MSIFELAFEAEQAGLCMPRSEARKTGFLTTRPNYGTGTVIHNIYCKQTYIIQLMHSFEVNFRICQPENSDVHRGKAEVNITFEG